MRKKVLLRTTKKLGSFFGMLFLVAGGMFLSSWMGKYLFNNPMLGNAIFIAIGAVSGVLYLAYKEAKYEVETENKQLIQELTKNG